VDDVLPPYVLNAISGIDPYFGGILVPHMLGVILRGLGDVLGFYLYREDVPSWCFVKLLYTGMA